MMRQRGQITAVLSVVDNDVELNFSGKVLKSFVQEFDRVYEKYYTYRIVKTLHVAQDQMTLKSGSINFL